MAGGDVIKNEEALIGLVDSALLYISRVAFVEAGSTSKQARYGKPGLVHQGAGAKSSRNTVAVCCRNSDA
jgi:hypothetical protein